MKLNRISGAAVLWFAATAWTAGLGGGEAVCAGQKEVQASSGESCTDCHEGIADAKFVHEPAADESGCTACHALSDKEDHPTSFVMEGQGLCFQCHDPRAFEGAAAHPPAAEGECLKCHRPHGSEHSALLKAPPEKLCMECHGGLSAVSKIDAGAVPGNPGRAEKEAAVHAPFGDGRCLSCHVPHAGDTEGLLNGNYPADLYASFSNDAYSFCVQCHGDLKESLSEERTRSATAFRNGDLNLHFVHVNQEKGRTCRSCHQSHRSENPKLMRRVLPFGKKLLQILYSKTEAGGRCTSPCHFQIEYDRNKPIPNAISAIKTRRTAGAKAEVSAGEVRSKAVK